MMRQFAKVGFATFAEAVHTFFLKGDMSGNTFRYSEIRV